MRLIDGNALIELINGGYDLDFNEVPETKRELLRMIMEQPTVDAVPVVRCKNCKYFTRDTITGVTIPGTEYCIFTMNNRIEENDFCSRAERKEE